MADPILKAKIKDSLQEVYFHDPEDAVAVYDSDESDELIHLVIVSPKFRGKRLREKTDLILSKLYQELSPEEWGKVTLFIGVSPEEVEAI